MATSVIPVGTLLLIFSLFTTAERIWWWFAQPWLVGAVAAARYIGGVDYRVRGMEHLPAREDNQRIILCPKHQSTWETFFFPSMMPHPLAYVFKRELLYVPFFGWSMARLEMVHIDRSARSAAWNKVATLGASLMDKGKWVIMFPEGTRTSRGRKGDYKTGAARLAIATNASIVPIAVASGRCWPRKTFRFIPGVIDVSIGEPLEVLPDESPVELMARVEAWIETEMRLIDTEVYPESEVREARSIREEEWAIAEVKRRSLAKSEPETPESRAAEAITSANAAEASATTVVMIEQAAGPEDKMENPAEDTQEDGLLDVGDAASENVPPGPGVDANDQDPSAPESESTAASVDDYLDPKLVETPTEKSRFFKSRYGRMFLRGNTDKTD